MSPVLRSRGRHCAPPRRRGAHRAPARRLPARTATIALGTVAAVAVGGGAYAFWTGTATGDAKAQSATAEVLTVAAGTAGTELFPGSAATNVNFVVSNGNAYPVQLTTLTSAAVTSSDEASCPADNITLASSGGYTLPSPITVGADSSSSGSLDGFASMKSTAADGCQGKTFTISLSFSGSQV